MKTDRREFLKLSGIAAGLGLAGHGANRVSAAEEAEGSVLPVSVHPQSGKHAQHFNMSSYAAPKTGTVKVAIIGLGQRGPAHLSNLIRIDGVEIRALCDLVPEKVEGAMKRLANTDHEPELYSGTADEWKKACEQKDVNLVVIATPYYMHTDMAVYAMEQGKHVASEVPAAATVEECWRLVETAERTRMHCMMLENYAYMPFQLLTLNMARRGFFGELVHCEGAYNTSKMKNNFNKRKYWNMWWLRQYASRKGNIYPTHGLGPISQMMDINRGDRFDFLVSVESKDFMMGARAKQLAKNDPFFEEFVGHDYRGNMSTTIIKTKEGRSIMLQHDATTPSPHNLIHGIYGTKGAALFDPPPARISRGRHRWEPIEELVKVEKEYLPEIFLRMQDQAKGSGHGGSDLKMLWHLVDCLHNGLPIPQDVYDAAAWSSVVPLTDWSVRNNSNSIRVPDFTNGAWKTNGRNMDIGLENGGANTKLL